MVHVKSLLPDPPTFSPTNIHTLLLEYRDVPDHVLYIDGLTGQKRTRNEFKIRVALARTALGSNSEQGGLGLDSGSMVAILSENCMVRLAPLLSSCHPDPNDYYIGIWHPGHGSMLLGCALRTLLRVRNTT